eukprot:COSAG01_NODE_2507_length_7552_cov_56.408560_12_plen_101_part_00
MGVKTAGIRWYTPTTATQQLAVLTHPAATAARPLRVRLPQRPQRRCILLRRLRGLLLRRERHVPLVNHNVGRRGTGGGGSHRQLCRCSEGRAALLRVRAR